MKKVNSLIVILPLISSLSHATDYIVDFTRVEEFESIRPLITGCEDYSALELYRDRLQASKNLEDMRGTLTMNGLAMFNKCSDDITGPGISQVKY